MGGRCAKVVPESTKVPNPSRPCGFFAAENTAESMGSTCPLTAMLSNWIL